MSPPRWFTFVCWIPLVLFVAGSIYVSQFEGWGAWAAAPLLLLPLAVSLALGLVGITLAFNMKPTDRRSLRFLVPLFLSWLPIIYVVLENIWRKVTGPSY